MDRKLLNSEERDYLRYLVDRIFNITGYFTERIIIDKDDPDDITIEFYSDEQKCIAEIKSKKIYINLFEKLDNDVSYDIDKLCF